MLTTFKLDGKYYLWYEDKIKKQNLVVSTNYCKSPILPLTAIEQEFDCYLRPLFKKLIKKYNCFEDTDGKSKHVMKVTTAKIGFYTIEEAEKVKSVIESYLVAGKLRGARIQ